MKYEDFFMYFMHRYVGVGAKFSVVLFPIKSDPVFSGAPTKGQDLRNWTDIK